MKFYQEKLGCKNKRAPTGIPIIIKKKKNKRWRGRGEIGPLVPCWWGRRIAQPPCNTGWRRFRKVRSELPRDPGIPLPVGGKRTERTSARNLCTDVWGPGQPKSGVDPDAGQPVSGKQVLSPRGRRLQREGAPRLRPGAPRARAAVQSHRPHAPVCMKMPARANPRRPKVAGGRQGVRGRDGDPHAPAPAPILAP